MFEWHDLVGSVGAFLILLTYFLLQSGRLASRSLRYSLLNAAGAALILVSLAVEFNFAAFLIELFWLLISIFGIVRSQRETVGPTAG